MPRFKKSVWPQFALAVSMLLPFDSILASAQDAPPVQVYLQQERLQWEQPPYIEQGNTMVPMRALFEKLGFTVTWEQETQTAKAKKGDLALSLSINKATADVNQTLFYLEVAPQIKNGSTFIPLRFVSEAAGANVSWEEATRTVRIDTTAADAKQMIQRLIENMTQSSTFTQKATSITGADGIKKNDVHVTNVAMNSDSSSATVTFQAGFTVSKAIKNGNGITISPSETVLYEFTGEVYKDSAGQWLLRTSPSAMTYVLKEKKPFMDSN
ncbi:copper amine oxidase N-terminal domain-containing protein [Paenibacillus sp. NPDC056579]|uniref:copper amine oxidase N-terminal domain-containing protein n=1 Tax=Paenibacillus sp. NPDC056579 TaxID=3345871 RepID=UPI0036A86ED9